MNECKLLKEMKKRIEAGEDPEKVIPYHVNLPEEYFIEVLYYALQVLPKTSPRYEVMERKLKEYAAR